MQLIPDVTSGAPETSAYPRFRTLLDTYAGYLARLGKPVRRAAPHDAARLFLALDEAQRARVLGRLETEIEIFTQVLASGERLTETPQILWRLLGKTGHTPCSDIFGKMSSTDVVEVYGADHRHIFQNFNFYDYVSFDLETIFCAAWHQATRRDPEIEARIYECMAHVFTGAPHETFNPSIPLHVFEELGSERLYRVQIRVKWLSPLVVMGQTAGFILVHECKIIGAGLTTGN